jgi:hypothetical protein
MGHSGKKLLVGLGILGACLSPIESFAQSGQYAAVLKRSLEAIQAGTPNYSDMEPLIADVVENQLQNIRPKLANLGPVQKLEFRGMQPSAMGPAEYYRVNFEKGRMSWMVNLGSTGKINVLWSSGDVN